VNPGGLVVLIAGVWVVCQVFGGNALQRMKILKPSGDGSANNVIAGVIGGSVSGAIPGGPLNPVTPWGILGGGLGVK